MSEEQQPELKINMSGVFAILFMISLSIAIVYMGYRIGCPGIIVWGYIFLLGTILSLLVVASRIFALKVFIGSIREDEEKRLIEERIKKILEEKEQYGGKEEEEEGEEEQSDAESSEHDFGY